MTERNTPWPAGTPCWADLATTDIAAARTFYGALFGWTLVEGGPDAGGYLMAQVNGRTVAGLGPVQPGAQSPPVWTTYLASADAGTTADAVTAAGGTVLAPPFDVMDVGVMAVAADPTGAVFGVWQAKAHFGAELANVANTVTWNEVLTRDYPAAKAFYASVFGYTFTDVGGGFQYSTIELDGATVAGVGALPEFVPADVPSHWRTYFAVEDTDAAVAAAERLGGRLLHAPHDSPYGRLADVADPQGASFSVIKPADPRWAE